MLIRSSKGSVGKSLATLTTGQKKPPGWETGAGLPLIFQATDAPVGLGTVCKAVNVALRGCRGFTGPIPPPLLIRAYGTSHGSL